MEKNKQSYIQIFKSTSIFGGVQLFNIIINVIRSKLIAILLGPAGMGISGLYTSTISLIDGITNLGIGTSAIKEIAKGGHEHKIFDSQQIIKITTKLVWLTGSVGALVAILFSSKLSVFTFGSDKYKNEFMFLSVSILLGQVTNSHNVILQGMRELKSLAKSNLFSSLFGLFFSIPIYYYFKIDGIIIALISSSILSLFVSRFYAKPFIDTSVKLDFEQYKILSKRLLSMGLVISFSGFITLGASYLMRIYISRVGSVSDVGLYNAGFTLIGTYVGVIFTAMGTDYFPRLVSISNDAHKTNQLINQQAEVAILILAPILCVFFIFINNIISLLYSDAFININSMINFAALGVFFKAVSWSIGYIILAKGTARMFFINELISNSYLFLLNIFGYRYFGLEGLGVSYLIGYIFHFLQIYIFSKIKYGFVFEKNFFFIFSIQIVLAVACFLLIRYSSGVITYILGIALIISSFFYSLVQINKRIPILKYIVNEKAQE